MYTPTMDYTRKPFWQKKYKNLSQFGGNREVVIQRDKERCVECGVSRTEHYARWARDITVDHINRLGNGVSREKKDNSLSNLQTLCIRCHTKKDALLQWKSQKKYAWSVNHPACISCNSTDRIHQAKGYCRRCYGKLKAKEYRRAK